MRLTAQLRGCNAATWEAECHVRGPDRPAGNCRLLKPDPVVLKLHSKTIIHKTDVGGVQLNLADDDAVRDAYRNIEPSVRRIAGAEYFEGVTVQPMVKLDGYELITAAASTRNLGRCSSSAREGSRLRYSKTGRSAFHRSIQRWPVE